MAWFTRELTYAAMCCPQPRSVSEPGTRNTLHSGTAQTTSQLNGVRGQREMQHLRTFWIPLKEVQQPEKSVAGTVNLFVDHLFGTGGTEMEQHVLARLRKDFQVGSEDWNDVLITGQRIRWMKDPQSGPSIEVSQGRGIEELGEIPVEKNTNEDLHCTPGNAYQVQKPSKTDKLVTKQDTVSVLLQVCQMCFKGSFSYNC